MKDRSKRDAREFWSLFLKSSFRALPVFLFFSCGAPGFNINTPEGVEAIKDATRLALTREDCAAAIAAIEPLYDSGNVDNETRLLRAAAHGCNAGINFFTVVNGLTGANLAGPEFWTTITGLFPSETTDSRLDSAWFSMDSLMATIGAGTVIPSSSQINAGTNNVGSIQASHRTEDSNAYMIFAAIASMGVVQNRFGNPDSTTFEKGNVLPWFTSATMDETGCAYAGSVLNMLDGISETSNSVSGSIGSALSDIADTFSIAVGTACVFGCQGFDWDATPGFDANCTHGASDCVPCPLDLRYRTNCGTLGSQASCAAAGIVNFINNHPSGWQGP